jgi:ATP-binding protein involved in chromosome partitioning
MSIAATLHECLAQFVDPNADRPLSDTLTVSELIETDTAVTLRLTLPYAAGLFARGLEGLLMTAIQELIGDRALALTVDWEVAAADLSERHEAIAGVKHIIAVASGKGGVGKSTTATNVALALQQQGASVGILDADIYGPSQAMMLGVAAGTRPEVQDEKWMLPVESLGIKSMSMAYLIDESQPMVWRGPMVSSALQQMLFQTRWGALDYLVVDMPPGTGDIQLTFSQKVPATGALIVTTPQDIALQDAVKGIEMFRKVSIPVLGIVENMSMHICSNCGHEEAIFGELGGSKIAETYNTRLLGSMPLDASIRHQVDGGQPSVVSEPDGVISGKYHQIALGLAAEIAAAVRTATPLASIEIAED